MTNATLVFDNLRGVLLPITTPFRGELIDYAALSSNIRRWSSTGVKGYVVLGSTGERVHLDEREYLELISIARELVPASMSFIVGAGQQSTRATINEIRRAAQAGADAVLVLTPSFYRSAINPEALVNHYKAIAERSPVPVVLYSMPALTGIKIEPETIAQLSTHPNIVGVKDSSNDIAGFKRTVDLCPAEFAVMSGNGTVFVDALEVGATGGILAVGCVVPELCVEIFRLFRAGELERARTLQNKLTPLAAAATTRFGIGGLKAALEMAGYRGGEVRAPLQPPSESERAEIAALLDDCRPHNDVP